MMARSNPRGTSPYDDARRFLSKLDQPVIADGTILGMVTEIERLRAVLAREHKSRCALLRRGRDCTCGHQALADRFEELRAMVNRAIAAQG
jgi:hypothetical protein